MDLCSGFGFLLALNMDAQLRNIKDLRQPKQKKPNTETLSKVRHTMANGLVFFAIPCASWIFMQQPQISLRCIRI